jgi:hypothetical protein
MKHIKLFESFLDEKVSMPDIKKGDSVIENPEKEGFGFKDKVGKVISVEKKPEFVVFNVQFPNGKTQEYHDDEIILHK